MSTFTQYDTPKTPRIDRLVKALFATPPEIEADRAVLITESYQSTEGEPIITRRAKAFEHILRHLPITIRPDELIVGSNAQKPRSCQTFPEYSYAWLDEELDTIATRSADPFAITEETKARLREVHRYWKGKTTSELATAYMAPEALRAFQHGIFTTGNYFYNGIGHICVDYGKVLKKGFRGIREEAQLALARCQLGDGDYARRHHFLEAVIRCCDAAILYARRYAALAREEAAACADSVRRAELLRIAENCERVPENGASSFYEACQSFWFVQMLIQTEGSGHSISPGRFDQYLYPYYAADRAAGTLTPAFAQELIDCLWVKLNDLNKARDAASSEGFAGYSLFQNLIVGGQNENGEDVTNDLSFMCLEASMHIRLPAPSLSVRVWNGSPHEFLIKAAELTRTGIGLPAYYNDEVIIPALMSRGLTLDDARNYCIIGCVEPQCPGKTDGWHDAAFFNMCRIMELVFRDGEDHGEQLGIHTGDVTSFTTFEQFFAAYEKQMNYMLSLLVNSDNAIDTAHAVRCPLPFLSSMVEDCIGRGMSVQEGGAHYNFTGPQGFGIANMADAMLAIKTLVFDQHAFTLAQLRDALRDNFGRTAASADAAALASQVAQALADSGVTASADAVAAAISRAIRDTAGETASSVSPQQQELYDRMLAQIEALPKYGNDDPVADAMARRVAYTYTRPLQEFRNPRGGQYQAGLYPVSANVPLGAQTGATPDGRLAGTPVADGVSPVAGRDTHGPTAAANSVARLDHAIASNGTLYNMKFHPSALAGRSGLENFVALIRGFFDQKGMHMQFNVVSRETLLDAQAHPENYRSLVVRVAGYSALFTTLSRSLQDDIIRRTEQGGF